MSATAQKSTKANLIKIHRKIKHHERICHAQHIGLTLKVKVIIRGQRSSHCLVTNKKNLV